jgi:hypothetical protein
LCCLQGRGGVHWCTCAAKSNIRPVMPVVGCEGFSARSDCSSQFGTCCCAN